MDFFRSVSTRSWNPGRGSVRTTAIWPSRERSSMQSCKRPSWRVSFLLLSIMMDDVYDITHIRTMYCLFLRIASAAYEIPIATLRRRLLSAVWGVLRRAAQWKHLSKTILMVLSTSKAKKYLVQLFKNDDKRGGSAGCAMMLVFRAEYFFGITMQSR